MAGTATKLHVLDCGSMSCDLTWLLLKPGRSIRPRAERDKPVEWYPCTTHAVVVETPVSGDTEFLPGVTLIEAPGHTPGTMALRVDLADEGTMIFTSDAVYMGDSYGPPATPAAIVNDLGAWYASVEKIRGIAEKSNAQVVFGHDADQLWSMRRSPEGFYS